MDVTPVFFFQQVEDDGEEGEKRQYPRSHAHAVQRGGVRDVAEEVGNVVGDFVVFFFVQRSRGDGFEADQAAVGFAFFLAFNRFAHFFFVVNGFLDALQFPQRVRHAGAREDGVVESQRTAVIAVEAAQVVVDVGAAFCPCGQRQVGRGLSEPFQSLGAAHRGVHLFNVFGTGEDEVLCTDFRVDLQVAEGTVVALVFQRVATGAVVDEVFGAVLQ